MSNLNIEGSERVVRQDIKVFAEDLRGWAALLDLIADAGNLSLLDWEAFRDTLDLSLDDLFQKLGIVEEIEFTDEGILYADEEDEPDYYDDEVQ